MNRNARAFTPEEWQARVDLAAAHRLAYLNGFNEGIFNHFTLVVPGKPDRFLVIPFGLHWSEITASVFLEVDFNGKVLSGVGDVERSAFCIHAPIHVLAPTACVLHTHMPFASALTRIEKGRLEPTGQTEAALAEITAYDDDYTGLAFDPAEGERLAGALGEKKILFMANHGVLVVGETIAEAYDRLYYLERACQVQVYAMWTGRPLKKMSNERTQAQFEQAKTFGTTPPAYAHFEALKRTLDRAAADYAS
jgi:ribulose-5-phosphate 4-epimerase/fuculose-1-phosphate aldolase